MSRTRPPSFRGRHFEDVIIILCVRVVPAVFAELPRSERDDGRARTCRGPRHHLALGPALRSPPESAASPRTRRPTASWRVDETYIKVAGTWTYLYRAVDSAGDRIDFMLSPKRDFDGGAAVPALGVVRDWQHSATGDQCGWASGICPRDCRIEAIRGSGPALPLPALTVFEQYY